MINDLDKFLQEAQARCDRVVSPTWKTHGWIVYGPGDELVCEVRAVPQADTRTFIAAARTDLPRALAVIRVLRAAIVYAQIRAGALSDHQLWGTLREELDKADALARGEEGTHGQ